MKKLNLVLGALILMFVAIVGVKADPISLTQTDFNNAKSENEETKALATAKGIVYHESDGTYSHSFNIASGTYTLAGDIEIFEDDELVIADDATVVIDFNKHSITQADETYSALIINDGKLTVTGSGSLINSLNSSNFLNLGISSSGNLVVENGTFNGGIFTQNGTTTINGGTFGSTSFGTASTGIVNNGTFNAGFSISSAKKVTINGGTFTNSDAALMISNYDANPEVVLAGGAFKATGKDAKGAILAMVFGETKTYDFAKILADGCSYSVAAETKTEKGESPDEIFVYLDTKEIKVVEANNSSEEATNVSKTDEKVVEEATKGAVDEAIKTGKATTGISDTLATLIKAADTAGKEITTELTAEPIDATNVSDDIKKKVEDSKGDATVLGYFDIEINVLADGEKLGNITALEKGMKVTIDAKDLIATLPEILSGKTRVFKIVRIHDGEATILDVTLNDDGTITFISDKFSDYILTYEDVDATTNPNTLDNITTYIILSIISIIGISGIVLYKKVNN